MNILVLYREQTGCDYHRIYLPLKCLTLENGESIRFIGDSENVKFKDFYGIDLVIFNRYPTIKTAILSDLQRQMGFKIWVDLDDYWNLYPGHPMFESWKRNNIESMITNSIRMADVVTVTNLKLLRKVQEYNTKVKVIPNGVPIGLWQFEPNKSESEYMRFMYCGGPTHYRDLRTIETYFSEMNKVSKASSNIRYIMAGYNKHYQNAELHLMNNIMKTAPNYETRPGLPLDKYMDHYNHADVCLAPLENNEFNTYKSNLKIIEAGSMGVPILCSDMYPFLEDAEMNGIGIFLCKHPEDWYETTLSLFYNQKFASEVGKNLYDYVCKKYNLLKINELRRDIINSFK